MNGTMRLKHFVQDWRTKETQCTELFLCPESKVLMILLEQHKQIDGKFRLLTLIEGGK